MNFLRNLLAAIFGGLIAFGIIIFMFIIFAALANSGDGTVTVANNSILELTLEKPLKEYDAGNAEDPFATLFSEKLGLNKILKAIDYAETDSKIKGISIDNNFLMAGMAQTKTLRDALLQFKNSGKFVYAYADFYSQRDYYLASVADSIFINPVGALDFKGLSSEVLFFKDLQEKSGVKMEVIRHGKYKSAVEPFLNNEMSDNNRTQISELLISLWGGMLEEISTSRGISTKELNGIADELNGRTPKLALQSKLIDGIVYADQYTNALKNAIGDKKLKYVSLEDYISYSAKKGLSKAKDRIAVIYAEGDIIYGEGSDAQIGQGIINEALRKARKSSAVKAIVIRVNSPGGSALASDIIWREIEITKKEKPVIISMGDLAASGGYYISAGADRIFAEPNTITGSIGVFGVIPNFYELSKDIGVNSEQVGTNKRSVGYSVFEPISDDFKGLMQEGIEEVYTTFLTRVAEGRGMTIEAVDKVAQGRVWSGLDAIKLGLVDEIGGLDDAISYAASEVSLEDYKIKEYPKFKTGIEKLMEDFSGVYYVKQSDVMLKETVGEEFYAIINQLKKISKQKGVQARMPFEMSIK